MTITKQEARHPISNLLVRRAEEEPVKAVPKPRKMNLVRPTRKKEKTGDFANSSLLVFPTDRLGITREIKAAMIRAASRIGTDPANLALIDETLDILNKHLLARFAQNGSVGALKRRGDVDAPEQPEDPPAAISSPEEPSQSAPSKWAKRKGKK